MVTDDGRWDGYGTISIGLLLGIGYSAVAQYFNHTFRSRDDVERILGVRSVMQIPMLPRTQA